MQLKSWVVLSLKVLSINNCKCEFCTYFCLYELACRPFWVGASGNSVVIEADAFKESDVIYKALSSSGHHDMLHTAELVCCSIISCASILKTSTEKKNINFKSNFCRAINHPAYHLIRVRSPLLSTNSNSNFFTGNRLTPKYKCTNTIITYQRSCYCYSAPQVISSLPLE